MTDPQKFKFLEQGNVVVPTLYGDSIVLDKIVSPKDPQRWKGCIYFVVLY